MRADGRSIGRLWTLLLAALACVSCTRLEAVPLPQYNADDLVGHQVRVTTTDGRVLEFEVATVTDDAISGEGERVEFGEIEKLERRAVSGWKTAAAATGAVAVAAAVALVVFLVVWVDLLSGT
jgi:hypothetical protein